MIRKGYEEKLKILHEKLVEMGKNCEFAIEVATRAISTYDEELIKKAKGYDLIVDDLEKDIGDFCVKLILREQPVAEDLRKIIAAQRIIVDMERVGDQASDIADLTQYIKGNNLLKKSHLSDIAREASVMLSDGVESYINLDEKRARKVIKYDDIVDNLFLKVKDEIAEIIQHNKDNAGIALDLLMIAKYLERIGDHACNISEETLYVISGVHK